MPRFVYDKATDRVVEVVEGPRRPSVFPSIQRDLPAYFSVASRKMIDGRSDRREDLKRTGTREVDPSEKPTRVAEPSWVQDWRQDRGIERKTPNE